jgi:hypothetical protein
LYGNFSSLTCEMPQPDCRVQYDLEEISRPDHLSANAGG